MSEHNESIYKNNCFKFPMYRKNKHLNQLENQVRKLSIESDDNETNRNNKQKLKSFLEFYDSIPEYDDINHLSNKEFYRKLDYLRERQRKYYECLLTDSKYNSWYDNYKALSNSRNSIIKCKQNDEIAQKPPSRRSVRIESPEVTSDKVEKHDTYRSKSRAELSSADSKSRSKHLRKASKSSYNESTLDEFSDCSLTTRSAPCSPRKQTVAWKDVTPSDTFKMTVRDEDNKIIDQILIDNKKLNKPYGTSNNNEMFRANPVPIESRVPLFERIMYEQEKRREHVKRRSKEALKSRMRLFSFTKREEEIADITRRLSKSSPDLFMCFDKQKTPQFKAKPVPKNLFSNYAYQKMHEDQYYRSLQKKVRAEEMLKTASLPPSMAKREKSKPKFHICPKSFREMYECQLKKFPPSSQGDLGKELAELELDFIMSTPSPVCKTKPKTKRKKSRKSSTSSSSKSSRRPSTLESVNRSNLAAVLRIQTSRKRMEDEISRRLEEAQLREETRWRAKVMRKRPVWQSLKYSHEEDLNMRLQMRKDEEKMRNEEHRVQMHTMYGRVNQQPTLFERQSNTKIVKTRDDLISQLYAESMNDKFTNKVYEEPSRSTSNASTRKCVEMKDESVQAKFDDLFNISDDDNQKTSEAFPNKHFDNEHNFDVN